MKKEKHLDWISTVIVTCLLIAGLSNGATNSLAAEKYPSRPIQVLIGFEPGSPDAVLRVFTDKITKILGQPVNFVFKPGATGTIAVSYVASSKPDGYTLVTGGPGPFVTAPLTLKGITYTLDDLTPICMMAAQPGVIFVKNDARWKTLKDFIDEAKKNPGKLTYATAGVFGTDHIPMEQLQLAANFKITHMPAQGSGPALTALLGGHVDLSIGPTNRVGPQIKAGTIHPLALVSSKRSLDFPNLPTLVDLGYPVTWSGWFGLLGPKGMPAEVVQTLDRAFGRALQDYGKEIEDQYNKMGTELSYLNSADFAKQLQSDNKNAKKIIEEIQKSSK